MMRLLVTFLVALLSLAVLPAFDARAQTAPNASGTPPGTAPPASGGGGGTQPPSNDCASLNPASCTVGALGSIYKSFPQPHVWVTNTWQTIKTAKLPQLITGLAVGVLLFGIIWNGIQIANGGYLGNLTEFGLRLLLAAWIVLASGSIGSTVRSTWIDAYRWGLVTFTAPAFDRAAAETQLLGSHVRNVTIAAGTLVAGGGLLSAGRAAGAAGVRAAALNGARTSVNTALTAGSWLMNMTMPIVLTYYVTVMGTGFGVLLASIMIPLSGAMLIFSGSAGGQWISNWFRATSAALFTVAFVPLVIAGAMEIGFTGPAKEYTRKYIEIEKEVAAKMEKINEDVSNRVGSNLNVFNAQEVAAAFQGAIATIQAQVASWFEMAMALFWAILMLIIGIVAAVYFLRTAQGWVIQFVGGVVTAVRPTNFGASVPKLGVGGGGESSSTSKSSASPAPSPAPPQVGPTQVGPTQVGPTQIAPTQVGPTQIGATQLSPTRIGATAVGVQGGGTAVQSGTAVQGGGTAVQSGTVVQGGGTALQGKTVVG